MSYAIKKDGTAWRAVSGPDDVESDEDYSEEQPALIEPPAEPIMLNAWQIRKGLSDIGKRAAAEAAVAQGDQDLKDAWNFWPVFKENHPLVIQLATALGISDADRHALFVSMQGVTP